MKQRIICLDFEGTLAPELWPLIAESTGIEELKVTTREYPSFPDLMEKRIAIMNEHGVTLGDIIEVARNAEPLDEAKQFLSKLRDNVSKVVIASDLAEELALPLLAKLENPLFFGHRFVVADDGSFERYAFRQDDPKRKLVEAYHSIGLEVYAAGDSYNDITMLQTAERGVLFRSTPKVIEEYPQFVHTEEYNELYKLLTEGAS